MTGTICCRQLRHWSCQASRHRDNEERNEHIRKHDRECRVSLSQTSTCCNRRLPLSVMIYQVLAAVLTLVLGGRGAAATTTDTTSVRRDEGKRVAASFPTPPGGFGMLDLDTLSLSSIRDDPSAIKEAATERLLSLVKDNLDDDFSNSDVSAPVAHEVVVAEESKGVVTVKFTQFLLGELLIEGASLAMHIDIRDGSVLAVEGTIAHATNAAQNAPAPLGCESAVDKSFDELLSGYRKNGSWTSACEAAAILDQAGNLRLAFKRARSYRVSDDGPHRLDTIFASRSSGSLVAVRPRQSAEVLNDHRGLIVLPKIDWCFVEREKPCNQTLGCFDFCDHTCDGPKTGIRTCKLCKRLGEACVRNTECCRRNGTLELSCQNNVCWPTSFACPAIGSPTGTGPSALASAKSGSTCKSRNDCCGGSTGSFQLTCDGTTSSNKKCVPCKRKNQGPCARSSQCCKGLSCKNRRCTA
jgi:hypothetical protein